MIAVIFEVTPTKEGKQEYLDIASRLREHLSEMPGFISIERFQSLAEPAKLLSLSCWEDESALERWRNHDEHRCAQTKGRDELFQNYRIRVCSVVRDYTMTSRDEAPHDSSLRHAKKSASGP